MSKKGKIANILFMILCLSLYGVIYFYPSKENISLTSSYQSNNDVNLIADEVNRTATMSNKYITIKFNNKGVGYSLVKDGKELIGSAKGFYASINGGTSFDPTSMKMITNTKEMADIAYISEWGELHYVLRNNMSGVYSYFVVSNLGNVGEFRTLYRPDGNIFRNGYTSTKSGQFPTLDDIQKGTKLQDETWRLEDGSVYTKYDWADYEEDDHLHGLYGNGYGMWMIPVSNEYYSSGPMRQELMVHLESKTGDGVLLNMLNGSHFGMKNITIPNGKIYGPWLVYINDGNLDDAKKVAKGEENLWPYSWLKNENYPLNRTSVSGKLSIPDGRSTSGVMVTLARSGDFYTQGEDYIFYSRADANGNFTIKNVRPGSYTLYAYSTSGTITGQFEQSNITVSGDQVNLGTLNWNPSNYNLLWNIGKADRLASEFKFGNLQRQYGLPAMVPENLTYTIGKSNQSEDWYYAQTKQGKWNINFNVDKNYDSTMHLNIAIASVSRNPVLDLYVNGDKIKTLDYSNENDQTTYRSANKSGKYRVEDITFPSSMLKAGDNIITLDMTKANTDGGIMYDMIKLEAEQ